MAGRIREFFEDAWEFIRSLRTASTPDSRWGALQLVLAVSFFCLGIVLALLSVEGGGRLKVVVVIASAVAGVGILAWALWLGVHYFRESKTDKVPILVVTKTTLKISGDSRIENGRIRMNTGKYEIEIREIAEDSETGGNPSHSAG